MNAIEVVSFLVVFFAVLSVLSENLHQAAFYLFMTGMGLGVIYLLHGVEFSAFSQWFFVTFFTSVFVMGSKMLGKNDQRSNLSWMIVGSVSSLIFGGLLIYNSGEFDVVSDSTKIGAIEFGRELVSTNLPLAQVVLMSFFVTALGIGYLARPEVKR